MPTSQPLLMALLITLGLASLWAETVAAERMPRQVRLLLERRCVACHNEQEPKGQLSLTQFAAARRGGDNGPAIIAGKPGESLLLDYVTGADPEMPKEGPPLSDTEIAQLRDWIRSGAPWPTNTILTDRSLADLNWWSLQPLRQPPLPRLRSTNRANELRTPIDTFVWAQLERRDLGFSAEADRRTLIRRLYFDLLGLPPTRKEIHRFVQDPDPHAYEKLLDRLLASPRYGERWARHWLDLVHYGDTHGYDKDKPRPNAWPYRDYVISAFNTDKPYRRFVREQIAGDVLWPNTTDGITATGFLAAGPWDFIGHAEVPETKIDGQVARHLDRDDMVTTTISTFLSTTVQCAQCHQHKFDPISQHDYYSLQAVFAALDRADRSYDADPQIEHLRRQLATRQKELKRLQAALEKQIEQKKTDPIRKLEKQQKELQARLQKSSGKDTAQSAPAMGYHSQVAQSDTTHKWVQVDLGQSLPLDQIVLFGAHEYGWSDFGFPHRFKIEAANDPSFQQPQMLADHTAVDQPRPGARALRFTGQGHQARYLRVTATRLWNRRRQGNPKTKDWIFAVGELAVLSNGRLAKIHGVTAQDSIEALPSWGRQNLADGIYGKFNLPDLAEVEYGVTSPTNGYHSQLAPAADTLKWVQVDLGARHPLQRIELVPARPTDWKETPGFGFPVRFRLEVDNDPAFPNPQLIFNQQQRDFANPGNQPVVVHLQNATGRYVRLTASRLWDRGGKQHVLAIAEITVFSGDQNIAQGVPVTALDSIKSDRWQKKFITDGFTSRTPLWSAEKLLLARTAVPENQQALQTLTRQLEDQLKGIVTPAMQDQQEKLQAELAEVQSAQQTLPTQQMVYAGTVHHGSGAFRGTGHTGGTPRAIHVLTRGDVTRPGVLVEPGTLSIINQVPAQFALRPDHSEGDRRVALAEWITHQENPLVWRSIANRIWQHHFGRGIVDTPNDLGRMGKLPTHPQLLDWLAVELRDRGQSLKRLHWLICNSRTYRQISNRHPRGLRTDGDNLYLWRMNRRKLEAEAIRDAVLWVSGRLNLQMGGPGFRDFVLEKPEHSPHYEYDKYDPRNPVGHRRAVYRFLVRSQPQPFMDTLDCADPSLRVDKRNETLTALQALSMLNNKFMVQMAHEFAEDLTAHYDGIQAQLNAAVQRSLGRSMRPDEREALTAYTHQHGLVNTCRLLFNLSEFMFVD